MSILKRKKLKFTKRKFLSFSDKTKHHQASKLVKTIYLGVLHKQNVDTLADQYRELETWLNLPQVMLYLEPLADRYHYHLKQVTQKQPQTLTSPSHLLDAPSSIPFLPIDIYLDNLRSYHNIGSILRTIEATRLGSIVTNFDLKHPSLKKTSMGTELLIPQTTRNKMKRPFIGVEIIDSATSLYEFDFPKSFSLFLGNEELGLSSKILEDCDYVIKIPLYGQKNSLNVSSAFSIVAAFVSKALR